MNRSFDSGSNRTFLAILSGCEPFAPAVAVAFDGRTEIVIEDGITLAFLHTLKSFGCQRRVASGPWFTIEQKIGVNLQPQLFRNFTHGHTVHQSHEIKTEAVDVIF
ncbi:hypothetical protein D3C73_1054670 [compost metagenome]